MDNTLTIDTYTDHRSKYPSYNPDFVWNFHVWCDIWLNRPDLPEGYDGWNCIDGCPVITRSGIQQCGPAPLKAIKNGDAFIQHDTGYMYACVNADVADWWVRQDKLGNVRILGLMSRDRNQVGSSIVTKHPTGRGKHDITSDYKHPSGSKEDEAAWEKALSFVGLNDQRNRTKMQKELLEQKKSDVSIGT